jgi:hypothetical protein
MANHEPILTSDTLTSLTQNLTKQRASVAHWRKETWRLTKLLQPAQCLDATSETIYDPDVAKVARIGLLKTTQRKAVVSTDGKDEAARREDAIKKTLSGAPLVTPVSIQQELDAAKLQWTAAEDACEYLEKEIRKEKTALAIAYSAKLKPKADALVKSFCQKQLEALSVWKEIYEMKQFLIDNEIGLHGMLLNLPSFLGAPSDPYSDMSEFFRNAKVAGFISAVPVGMRLS